MKADNSGSVTAFCADMLSLREFPDEVWWKDENNRPQTHNTYNNWFADCFVLDEINNLPVLKESSNTASSAFGNFCSSCFRLSNLTFATDNGTPFDINITRNLNWLLDYGIGYSGNYNLETYGIPSGKEVTDQASYEALKNDPDWWTKNVAYSRFNHDSAVALINSLPNNTNTTYKITIKLNGASGANTDGGAINTLTAEEIAVATNKNWAISIS